jgi:hypothetical protein
VLWKIDLKKCAMMEICSTCGVKCKPTGLWQPNSCCYGACVPTRAMDYVECSETWWRVSNSSWYYVQARLRNSQSYGYRTLSTPSNVIPPHNPPGPTRAVVLLESTSTSITVGWEKPTINGGKVVSGYELWMDSWSGGDTLRWCWKSQRHGI